MGKEMRKQLLLVSVVGVAGEGGVWEAGCAGVPLCCIVRMCVGYA